MNLRTSIRWFRHWSSSRSYINVPYVTKCGKFSIFRLITWHAYPEQVVASLTSTVFARLLKIWLKRKRRFVDVKGRTKDLLLKVAALYTVTHSDYFLDRALAVLHRQKALQGLVDSYVRKLDDKFWFVYSQVCYQTYWLTFRSLGISDKLSGKAYSDFMSSDTDRYKRYEIREAFKTASDTSCRTKFRRTPYVPVKKLRVTQKDDLAFFFNWSDPSS